MVDGTLFNDSLWSGWLELSGLTGLVLVPQHAIKPVRRWFTETQLAGALESAIKPLIPGRSAAMLAIAGTPSRPAKPAC
jgi:hypothetical protein